MKITKIVSPSCQAWYFNNRLVYNTIFSQYNTWRENVRERIVVTLIIVSCIIKHRSFLEDILWTTIEISENYLFPERLNEQWSNTRQIRIWRHHSRNDWKHSSKDIV